MEVDVRPCARGVRLSNAWLTCPRDGDNLGKLRIIPDRRAALEEPLTERDGGNGLRPREDGAASHQAVGGVMAHQTYNGYGP